jgi:LmbE family N-acetylglucosaminyl deacetylase
LVMFSLILSVTVRAQAPQAVKGLDDRYKVDILVVVAHPDDEGFFTPYLARAIYDMHKRVAVVFSTRGGSGGNGAGRERGPALANEREIEGREACAKLGISLVWFLDGKDTASQNVMDSLSNWGHGVNLEKLVGLIRLTRPEVVLTHFPGVFIGENHGDHQATGVLATEAFDLAANPTVFPSQLAGETKHYELYLSSLAPWQVRKIYYGSDADDNKQFDGKGPAYSVKEISKSLKKPYWRAGLEAALPHQTQFSGDIERILKMSEAELQKMMDDPNSAWWSEPSTLIFGKSTVGGKPDDDVFLHVEDKPGKAVLHETDSCTSAKGGDGAAGKLPRLELGGPWRFYPEFYARHGLCDLPTAKVPEIGVKAGTTLAIPVVVLHDAAKSSAVTVSVKAPEGWKVTGGGGKMLLPAEESTPLLVQIATPNLTPEELKKAAIQDVRITADADGKEAGEVLLRVILKGGALPQ